MKFQIPSFKIVLNGRTNPYTRTSQRQYAPHFLKVEGKMTDKSNRVLLHSNTRTSLFKFSKHCKFDENFQNTEEIDHWRPSHPKYCMGIFLDYNFLLDILSGKLTKFTGHFRNCFYSPTNRRFSRGLF